MPASHRVVVVEPVKASTDVPEEADAPAVVAEPPDVPPNRR